MIGYGPSDPEDIIKCDRCPQLEELAEGYRVALVESAKLLQFLLLPSTTDADRAEIYRKAFSDVPDLSSAPDAPPTPPGASKATKRPCGVIEHGPAGDPNCPDCKG